MLAFCARVDITDLYFLDSALVKIEVLATHPFAQNAKGWATQVECTPKVRQR